MPRYKTLCEFIVALNAGELDPSTLDLQVEDGRYHVSISHLWDEDQEDIVCGSIAEVVIFFFDLLGLRIG